MPVVAVQPVRQGRDALMRADVSARIAPLAQGGLDEALGLAVGARRVRPGAAMTQARRATGRGELPAAVAAAVAGQDFPDRHPEPGVEATREASSIAMCRYSHPASRCVWIRSPVMRWPTRRIRPSFFTSRCNGRTRQTELLGNGNQHEALPAQDQHLVHGRQRDLELDASLGLSSHARSPGLDSAASAAHSGARPFGTPLILQD